MRMPRWLSTLWQNCGGNVATIFAISTPVLFAGAGAAIDYASLSYVRTNLQAVADGAALAAARELRLVAANPDAVIAVAEDYARAAVGPTRTVAFDGAVNSDKTRVTVEMSEAVDSMLFGFLSDGPVTVGVAAEARVLGGAPTCMMGLNEADPSIVAVNKASITAPDCSVYANSTSATALDVKGGTVKASFVCSGGGVSNSGTISPTPRTDCPVSTDPLAARPAPTYLGCDYTNKKALLVAVLLPGVYCGGLDISVGTVATLVAGEYIIKDGPLRIQNGAIVTGLGAGFYLTGAKAELDIHPASTLNLTAPVTGPLAGMLFFEDRANAPGVHKMNSRNAPVMLGTWYLSRSELQIGAPGNQGLVSSLVGALSAWTIVVAGKVSVNDGLNLTLNTDYSATKVPVPEGVGYMSSQVALSK